MDRQVNLAAALRRWRTHWPLALVALLAALLLFTNLHRGHLWTDEADTAILGRNIVRFGAPTAWDGVTFIDSDYGARLDDNLVMIRQPLLQYYLVAASFAVFGEGRFSARLPFAALALGTILLAYALAWRASRDRRAATAAALLLTLSVQFLLYGRQSRYYAVSAFLSCLLVFVFLRLRSWRTTVTLVLVSVLLFHSHPMGLAPLVGLGVASVLYPPLREQRRWILRAAPILAVLVLPWLGFSMSGYVDRLSRPTELSVFLSRLAQFGVEVASVTPAIGAIVLWLIVRRRRGDATQSTERTLALALVAASIACGVFVAWTQTRDAIWSAGLRYTAGLLPFVAVITGILIARASRRRTLAWVALVLVFGFTKVGRVTPLVFWEEPTPLRDQDAFVTFHNPERALDRFFRTGHIAFARSLFQPTRGTTTLIAEYLARHGDSDDIVITNYGWESLYFQTNLRQGLKVLPSYPIWEAAHDRRLPRYVFTSQGARWVVWRRAWGAYRGHDCAAILRQLADAGALVTPVTELPETMWENRENIHFRRYPGNRYLFPWFDKLPSTVIFRVDWPAPLARHPGPPKA